MVFNICVKFHENICQAVLKFGADTKIVNRHAHTHAQRKDENIKHHGILRMLGV